MSYNENDSNKYICFLAHNMYRFAYWADSEYSREVDNKKDNCKDIKN